MRKRFQPPSCAVSQYDVGILVVGLSSKPDCNYREINFCQAIGHLSQIGMLPELICQWKHNDIALHFNVRGGHVKRKKFRVYELVCYTEPESKIARISACFFK